MRSAARQPRPAAPSRCAKFRYRLAFLRLAVDFLNSSSIKRQTRRARSCAGASCGMTFRRHLPDCPRVLRDILPELAIYFLIFTMAREADHAHPSTGRGKMPGGNRNFEGDDAKSLSLQVKPPSVPKSGKNRIFPRKKLFTP